MSEIVNKIVETLLYNKEKKLRNSGVSKQGSHDSISTFSHFVLQNITFFSRKSGEVGQTIFDAFIMQREQG